MRLIYLFFANFLVVILLCHSTKKIKKICLEKNRVLLFKIIKIVCSKKSFIILLILILICERRNEIGDHQLLNDDIKIHIHSIRCWSWAARTPIVTILCNLSGVKQKRAKKCERRNFSLLPFVKIFLMRFSLATL
jgi:hypothetical protein